MTTVERSTHLPSGVTAELLDRLARRINVNGERDHLDVVAPFTGEVIGTIPQSTGEDVSAAVARARTAQSSWVELSFATRARIFNRFHDLLIERADQAMDLVQLEGGKARIPAFEEIFDTVATTRYYVNTGPGVLKRKRRAVSFPLLTTAFEYRHPHGVVGFISPWNFPFTLAISDAIPALLAGNAVILKPDEKTPFSALYAVELLEEAGLPPDLIQVLTGRGEPIGSDLIDAVDFIMFTGSSSVGSKVAERAGRRLIGSSMELGGKNAAIVLSDADLDVAIPGVSRSVFANGGQLCIAMERIYVDESISAEFTSRFVEHVAGLEMNTRYDYSSDLSSIIDQGHMSNIQSHVDDAIAKGATLLTGGKSRPDVGPSFYEPTVLADVGDDMLLCRTETFGPVVSIYPVAGAEEAIAAANDSDMGLNYSVWTSDTSRGVEVASRLRAGTVCVNDGYAAAWSSYDAPMGGMAKSGLSRRHGREGILKYTEAQTVAVQRLVPAFAPPPGMSYERYQAILGPALKLLRRLPFYK